VFYVLSHLCVPKLQMAEDGVLQLQLGELDLTSEEFLLDEVDGKLN
jgi:hypothetical protein